MGDQSDRWLWEALLKQAQAHLETAHAIRLQSQLKLSMEGAVDMELDRLEAWFAADCDAEAGAVIAEQIVRQAEGFWQDEQQTVGSTGELGNAGGKGASPEKAEATQAIVAKPIVGTKRRVPSVLELLTTQRAAAVVAEGDKRLTEGVAPKAEGSSGAGDDSPTIGHTAADGRKGALPGVRQQSVDAREPCSGGASAVLQQAQKGRQLGRP